MDLIKDSAGFAVRGSNVRCEYSIPDDLWAVDIDPVLDARLTIAGMTGCSAPFAAVKGWDGG